MTRLAAPLLSLAVIFSVLSGGLAGPACSKKYWKALDCVQRCKSKWGVPGRMMGTDRWGAVMQKTESTKDAWDSIVSEACGMKPEKISSGDGPILGPAAGVGNQITTSTSSTPSVITTSSTTSSSSSSSSSSSTAPTVTALVKSFSSSKPAESSTPPPPPGTTSTPKPPPTTSKPRPAESPQTPKPPPAKPFSAGDGDIGQYLSAHNSVRAQHGASDLTWSDNLASKAQQWANNCKFEHSGGSLGPFGENLAAGTGDSYGISSAVKSWTDEVSSFRSNNPEPSHFTQVVWKASTQVGCAVQSCNGIFDNSFGKAKFFVCEYSPQGNVIGQFAENVQA